MLREELVDLVEVRVGVVDHHEVSGFRDHDHLVIWDGLDDNQMAALPGTYRVVVETNQEHGAYGKQAGTIECTDKPAETTLPATSNFEIVTIQFGPRPKQA